MRSALDTNVLVHAEGFGELFRVLTGKAGRSPAEAREAVLSWMDSFAVADSTAEALAGAMDLCVDHQLGSWDALVLSVAAEAGVRVVNPFAATLDPLLLQLTGKP